MAWEGIRPVIRDKETVRLGRWRRLDDFFFGITCMNSSLFCHRSEIFKFHFFSLKNSVGEISWLSFLALLVCKCFDIVIIDSIFE